MAQYPLANGPEGNPIDVPAEAVAWRVRRGGGRGRPRTIIDGETGRPLELPLGATVDEMADRGCPPGRYRLEAVDGQGQTIPGVVGITEVFEVEPEEGEAPVLGAANSLLERQMQLIEQQNQVLFRALDAMAGAFGTVQPQLVASAAAGAPPTELPGLGGFLASLKPEGLEALLKVVSQVGKLAKGAGEGGEA